MDDLFRSRRRRLGLVTLLITCAFVGSWVRAFVATDRITIPTDDAYYTLEVTWRGFSLSKEKDFRRHSHNFGDPIDWTISAPVSNEPSGSDSPDYVEFHHWWGLKVIRMENDRVDPGPFWRVATWTIPHWMLVYPLIVCSMLLLISRSRPSRPKGFGTLPANGPRFYAP